MSTAREVAEHMASIRRRCDDCGEWTGGLIGSVSSTRSDGSWYHRHGNAEDCERAKRVDYQLAYSIAKTILLDISRWAWVAATHDLTDEEWDALPKSVQDALIGIHVLANDGAAWRTYDDIAREAP